MKILLHKFKFIAFVLLILAFSENVNSQCTIAGTVNSSLYTCDSFIGCTQIFVGNGTAATTLNINSSFDLTCLGPINFVIRNNATVAFGNGANDRLTLAAGSGITVEQGGNISGGSNCTASDRIYIGAVLVSTCNGNGGAELDFSAIVNNGGYTGAAGTIGSAQTICSGSTPAPLTSIANGTGSGTITYEWQTNTSGSYVTIGSETTSTYSPPLLTATTSYRRRTVTSGSTYSAYTTPVTITVNAAVTAGAIGTAQTICTGATPVTLTSTTAGTGSGMITYEWQTNASGSYVSIGSATAATYSPPALTATTSYQRRTVSVSGGRTCYSGYTIPVTITVNPIPATPTVAVSAPTCASAATNILSVYDSSLTYTSTPTGLTVGAGGLITGGTNGTSYTIRATNASGCFATSASFTFNGGAILPTPATPTVAVTAPTCASAATNILSVYDSSLTYTSTPTGLTVGAGGLITGGTNGTSYTIRATNASGCFATSASFTFNGGAILSTPATPTVLVTAPTCGSAATNILSVYDSSLTYTSTPTGLTVGAGGVITGGTNGTSYTIRTTNASGCFATSASFTFNGGAILPTPVAPAIGSKTDITCASNTGSVTLTGLPSLGSWTLVRSGTSSESITGTGSETTITGLAPGTYAFAIISGTCISTPTGNVVINPVTTATWNVVSGVGSWTDGPPSLSKALVFDGNYSENTDLEGCSCLVTGTAAVTIRENRTLFITNGVTVSDGAALIFENNASLVQDNNSALNVGNIQYKRRTNIINKFDYTYWSSPVFNQRLLDVSPNTLFDKFFSFNASTDTWQQESTSNPMLVGKGYIIRGPQFFPGPFPSFGIHEATFTGRPNNGPIGIAIPFLGSESSNLIGNPYPSAIDADLFLAANNLILDGTLYFWTHNSPPSNAVSGDAIYNYTSNDYASYNGVGGVATLPAYLGGVVPSGKIAAGQAFFATGIAAGTAVFNNGMRVSGGASGENNSQFFKTNNTKSKGTNSVEKHRIWLNMTNTQGAFKQMLVGYVANATNGFDKAYDGQSFDGNEFLDFYSINDDKNLTIQGRALPFDKNDEVALGYSSTIEGVFSISIDQTDGILVSEDVFIEDKTTNTIKNLKEGAYNFSTKAGSFNDRFVLRYKDKTLGIDDFDKTENQVLISKDKNELKIKSELESLKRITVFDLLGRKVFDKEAINSNEFSISNSTLNKQIVIVKVMLTNGKVISKKVF